MKKIYKYIIQDEVSIPYGFKIVLVDQQNGTWYVWAEVDPEEPLVEQVKFEVIGTGWDISENFEHLKSYLEGPFVWHIYYKKTGNTYYKEEYHA